MCTERAIYEGEIARPGIFSGNPIMKRLRGLHQHFAKTKWVQPTVVNKCAFNTLFETERLQYMRQMRSAAAAYWEFGKGKCRNQAPDAVQEEEFASTFIEWRRMQMTLRATLAQAQKASWRLLSQIAE